MKEVPIDGEYPERLSDKLELLIRKLSEKWKLLTIIVAVIFAVMVIVIIKGAILISEYKTELRQDEMLFNLKKMEQLEYYHIDEEGNEKYKMFEINFYTKGDPYKGLWYGSRDMDTMIETSAFTGIRFGADSRDIKENFVALTIHTAVNTEEPEAMKIIEEIGFPYKERWYVVEYDGKLLEVADKTYFTELFTLLAEYHLFPPWI